MPGTIRKFTFDEFVSFESRREQPAVQTAPAAEEPPPPLFSEEEIAQARAAGFEEGRVAALLEYETAQSARTAQLAERIADALARLAEQEAARSDAFRVTAFEVALAAIRRLFPNLAQRFAEGEIDAAIGEVLGQQHDEPRVVIRVPDSAFDALDSRISGLAEKRGYTGKTVFIADAQLAPTDFRIEWADGGVERIAEQTLTDITRAIARLTESAHQAPARMAAH